MGTALQTNVIVDNRPGAGGVIGLDFVAKAQPDGLTLGLATISSLAAAPALALLGGNTPKPPYDPVRSFTPLGTIAIIPGVALINPGKIPAKNLAELVAILNSKPGQFNYASAGLGSASHFAGEQFLAELGLQLTHVPYKGTGPALIATISDETQVAFDAVASALPHIRSGKLFPIAVSADSRVAELPETPTFGELGHQALNYPTWFGIVGPAGMEDGVARRFGEVLVQIGSRSTIQSDMQRLGIITSSEGAQGFKQRIATSLEQHVQVVRSGRIRIQ